MNKKIETLCVQAGYSPKTGEPRVAPIVQSTTYVYKKTQEMADLFDLKADGFFYSRLANPTVDCLEKKVSALEGGVYGIACASGMSAIMLTVLTLCKQGDNILCASSVYGGTFNLFGITVSRLGIECRFFDLDDEYESILAKVDDKTRFIYCETVANPSIIVADFDKLSRVAKANDALFIVDNTLATPVLCRPIEFGANIVIHSTSKYLDGHAVALGGMIIDACNFNYKDNPRYPDFNVPDTSYHGLVYADVSIPFGTKCRSQMVRDTGAIMAPMNAFLTSIGCDTLALRMERHSQNALTIARYLEKHPKIDWVKYSGLESSPYYELAMKYMPKGQGGMMSFGLKGGVECGVKFMESLRLITQETHVADVRSCILHPASTTHRQLSERELELAGVPSNLLRLSVGIENVDDIIEDIDKALLVI